jgi:hypothetical protein
MDRNLEIALVSATLAIICAYALRQRLAEGYGQIRSKRINRQDAAAGFWTIMLFLGLCEALFIGMAVVYFMAWL